MRTKWCRFLSFILVFVLFICSQPIVFSAGNQTADKPQLDGTQSKWAEPELVAAYQYGLTYPGIMNNFKRPITREEFSIIVVKLYEKLSGKAAVAGDDPFGDTDNPEILKAYNLGIVAGVSKDKFAPLAKITRQEICVMIFQALKAALPSLDKSAGTVFPFTDINKIATWASDAMKFAYKNDIMKGKTTTLIAPLDNTSREEAIALLKRTYEKFSSTVGTNNSPPHRATIPVQNPPAQRESILKSYAGMLGGNAFLPKYDQRIELFVSITAGKPSQKPVSPKLITASSENMIDTSRLLFAYNGDLFSLGTLTSTKTALPSIRQPSTQQIPAIKPAPQGPYYTSASFGAFINQNGDRKRWFAYKLKNAAGAAKVVWQVSSVPFAGSSDNWKILDGLVANGEVPAAAGEFCIDFGNLGKSLSRIITINTSNYKPIPQGHKVYYVRAVPVNGSGTPIGSPGAGIAVVYGIQAQNGFPGGKSDTSCELWTTKRTYTGSYSGEFQDKPAKNEEVSVSPKDQSNARLFNFHNLDPAVTQIIIQVSEYPFTGNEPWPSNKKLLYEKAYTVPVTESGLPSGFPKGDYPSTVLVPFSQFGRSAADMQEDEYIKYYVRGVLLKPALTPGTVDVGYTNTVNIIYGYSKPIKLYFPPPPKYEYINRSLPELSIKSYTPVQWASSDYLQHYYVFRAPTADEIYCCWINSNTKEVLYPYDALFGQNYYKAQGINNKQQYEQIVIPRVLKPGYLVYFAPPKEEDKEWYQELFDGIVDFFKDLAKIATQIVNQVSAAYNGLKSGLINFVADLCPIPALKGAFKTALEGLVNYGLVAVGLPPTLPNFDELSSMSLDYLADVALTEAGIPANQMTDAVTVEIAGSIGEEIKKAASHSDMNPVGAPFLKLDPAYSYRPAYVDVQISNNSAYPTVPGSFDLDTTFEFDYYNMYANNYDPYDGISFTSDNPYLPGSAAGIETSSNYIGHFLYGLNGNTVNFKAGDKAIYDVFNPVRGQKVPILQPYETRTVRIYLSPYSFYGGGAFPRYPSGDQLLLNDFDNMYFGNGNKKFTNFYLTGYFPSALEFMNSDGKTYIVTDPEAKLAYKYEGSTSDAAKEKPVLSGWNK